MSKDINWGDPTLPPDYASQHIDDIDPEEPKESIDSEEDQDEIQEDTTSMEEKGESLIDIENNK